MLLVILVAPAVLRPLRVPHIVGYIVAGVLLGPHGFGILGRDASFEMMGQVGIYYIMFLAGLEMDMGSVRRHGRTGLGFGLLTLFLPFAVGAAVSRYVLGFGVASSLLTGSLLGSHTLVAYPIVGRYGLGKHPSVVQSIIATAVASFGALLILAIVVRSRQTATSPAYWLQLMLGIAVYLIATGYALPKVGRWFLRRTDDAVQQYIFILSLVFVSAWAAVAVGLEGLLGALVAGLALGRVIPRGGPLIVRLEFVGNALFVPWFLIGVGMLINVRVLTSDSDTLRIVTVIIAAAMASKWVAALIMQKATRGRRADRQLLFGLTNAHAAGALAIVMIGTAPAVSLMDERMQSATVMLILVSSVVSSLATDHGARRLALETTELERNRGSYHGKCLTAYVYPSTVDTLTQLSIMLRNPRIPDSLMGISVSMDDDPDAALRLQGQQCLDKARAIAASAGVTMSAMSRVSSNVASAVVHAMREVDAGEVLLGMHQQADGTPAGSLGFVTQGILSASHREVLLVHMQMPPGTVRRIVLAVPPKAEYEVGFYKWLEHVCRIGEQTRQPMHVHASAETMPYLRDYLLTHHPSLTVTYMPERGFGAMLVGLSESVRHDHLLVLVSSRAGFISHTSAHATLPALIRRSFAHTNVILLYPDQYGDPGEQLSVFAPNGQSVTQRQMLFESWLARLRA